MDISVIIEQFQQGDQTVFQEIFQMFYNDVYRTAYLVLKETSSAEDIVQETFMKVYRNLPNLQDPKKFSSWIKTIATRSALDFLRKHKKVIPMEDPNDQGAVGNFIFNVQFPTPESEVERKELQEKVQQAIFSLDYNYQEVILLKYYHNLSDNEIAATLGCPLGTVKSRTHRALKAILTKLQSSKFI